MVGKVLITQGLRPFAQRVARLLPAERPVLFASSEPVPSVLLGTGHHLAMPNPAHPAFVHEMLKTCLDNQVAALLPTGINELRPLAEAKQLFSEYDIAVWVPAVDDLDQLPIFENPPKGLPLIVLDGGAGVSLNAGSGQGYGSLSGVFMHADSGGELALCCVAD